MKSIWLPLAALALGIVALVWVGGVRIIVVPDMPILGKAGALVIVGNATGLKLIERPGDICSQSDEPGSDMCVAGTLAALTQDTYVLIHF